MQTIRNCMALVYPSTHGVDLLRRGNQALRKFGPQPCAYRFDHACIASPMLVALLLFYMGFYIQRRRYAGVVEAVRARLRSELPQRLVAAPK